MLSGVTVSCFLLSYLVVLSMEVARVFLKLPGRNLLLIGMQLAGLFAHSVFLMNTLYGSQQGSEKLITDWFQWSMVAAWCLAVAYLLVILRKPNSAAGLFLIPLILALIGVGLWQRSATPFESESGWGLWGLLHGVSLALGTMFIYLGMAFGSMYLLQSYRLKKRESRKKRWLKLPALEFLRSMNRLSLITSSVALGLGLATGIVLEFQQTGELEILSTGNLVALALFVWTLAAALFELSSKGSIGGRRGAYLAVANFVFLMIVLGVLFLTGHGQAPQSSTEALNSLRPTSTKAGAIVSPDQLKQLQYQGPAGTTSLAHALTQTSFPRRRAT